MALNTEKISLVREMSLSTIPKGTASIQGRGTGPGTSPGNQQSPELFHGRVVIELLFTAVIIVNPFES